MKLVPFHCRLPRGFGGLRLTFTRAYNMYGELVPGRRASLLFGRHLFELYVVSKEF